MLYYSKHPTIKGKHKMNIILCPCCQFQCETEIPLEETQHVLCPRCKRKHIKINGAFLPLLVELSRKNDLHRGACPHCGAHYEFDDDVNSAFICPECQKEFFVERVIPPADSDEDSRKTTPLPKRGVIPSLQPYTLPPPKNLDLPEVQTLSDFKKFK